MGSDSLTNDQKCIIEVSSQRQSIETFKGTSLMDALTMANILLRSDCGGGGGCGKCIVAVTLRDKSQKKVPACAFAVEEDLAITIPESSLLSFHSI